MNQNRSTGRNSIGWTVVAAALGAVAGAVATHATTPRRNSRTFDWGVSATTPDAEVGADTWWHGYAAAVKDGQGR